MYKTRDKKFEKLFCKMEKTEEMTSIFRDSISKQERRKGERREKGEKKKKREEENHKSSKKKARENRNSFLI